MICSSVNLDLRIVRLLDDGLSIQVRDQPGAQTRGKTIKEICRELHVSRNTTTLIHDGVERHYYVPLPAMTRPKSDGHSRPTSMACPAW